MPFRSKFTSETLADINILVIGNALHPSNVRNQSLPTPSALTKSEIEAVHLWISARGAILLLTDHMPFSGAAADLALAFGFEFSNGLVIDPELWGPVIFHRSDGSLVDHPITQGRSEGEQVNSVASFWGSAFTANDAKPLLVLGSSHVSYLTESAWEISDETPTISVKGWLQGAVKRFGKGRIAVFSDATIFSAQILPDGNLMGMNTEERKENLQLLLNIFHWLTGLLD